MKGIVESGISSSIVVEGKPYDVQPLLGGQEIQERVEEMGRYLAERYAERGSVHVLTVLNGALHFASDLRRSMQRAGQDLKITSDQIRVSSYTGASASGTVRLQTAMPKDLSDRHVLIVEDVLDSGLTLDWLTRHMAPQKPASVEVAVALHKENPERPASFLGETAVHSGFRVPNDFVIGYGLDVGGQYRDLDGVYKLAPTAPGRG